MSVVGIEPTTNGLKVLCYFEIPSREMCFRGENVRKSCLMCILCVLFLSHMLADCTDCNLESVRFDAKLDQFLARISSHNLTPAIASLTQ